MPRVEVDLDLNRALRAIEAAEDEIELFAPDDERRALPTLTAHARRLWLATDALLSAHADVLRQRDQAIERERIAATAYDQQQSSYRELEVLYQAMTERAQAAEDRIRRAAEHLPGRPDVAERILSEIRHTKSDTGEG